MLYKFSHAELKGRGAYEFADGDVVVVRKYFIYIHFCYTPPRPMKTWVETRDGKPVNSTPGTRGGWPYYIDDFISRRAPVLPLDD